MLDTEAGRKRRRHDVVTSSEFRRLEDSHPYGVLPEGNRLLESAQRASSSDLVKSLLTDGTWIHVFGFCCGRDLAAAACSCRYFYVACHQPELWRDLVLRKCQKENVPIDTAGPSWRDAYVRLFHRDAFVKPHSPIKPPGVYSDELYRLHSCRAFSIPSSWMDRESSTVRSMPVVDITETIFKKIEASNRPLNIEGAALSWKAMSLWSNPSYLLEQTEDRTLRATSGTAPLPGQFTLKAYYSYMASPWLEEAPLYLFDRSALTPGSKLWKDVMIDLHSATPFWNPDRSAKNGHDLFQVLGEGRRPDHTWLIMGPKRSGSVFHIDPNCTHAWNAAIMGRKRWLFYPPGVTPPGVFPSSDGDEVVLPLSVGEWLFQFWDEHVKRSMSGPVHERPVELTAMPGDIVFVPHGWWHMVVNLDDVNVAVTHNYVSDTNLSNVLRFLETKTNQISGCRDRVESIKPSELHGEFVKRLQKAHASYLTKAREQTSWTCRAWKDEMKPRCKPDTVISSNENGFCFSFSVN